MIVRINGMIITINILTRELLFIYNNITFINKIKNL
jgi:hypothetical protein